MSRFHQQNDERIAFTAQEEIDADAADAQHAIDQQPENKMVIDVDRMFEQMMKDPITATLFEYSNQTEAEIKEQFRIKFQARIDAQ